VALGDIDRAEQMYRKSDKERLTVQYEGGDVRAAREHIITQRPRDRR